MNYVFTNFEIVIKGTGCRNTFISTHTDLQRVAGIKILLKL